MEKNTGDIRFWTVKELRELKKDILSLLTDKNVGFVPTETKEEEFGALMAMSYAFREINNIFDNLESIIAKK